MIESKFVFGTFVYILILFLAALYSNLWFRHRASNHGLTLLDRGVFCFWVIIRWFKCVFSGFTEKLWYMEYNYVYDLELSWASVSSGDLMVSISKMLRLPAKLSLWIIPWWLVLRILQCYHYFQELESLSHFRFWWWIDGPKRYYRFLKFRIQW